MFTCGAADNWLQIWYPLCLGRQCTLCQPEIGFVQLDMLLYHDMDVEWLLMFAVH